MKWATSIIVGLLVLALGYHFIFADYDEAVDEVVVEDVPEQVEPVDIRAEAIYNNSQFQEEMRTMALARAQFELSLEKQAEATKLSLQAKSNYDKAQNLESQWHDDKTIEE